MPGTAEAVISLVSKEFGAASVFSAYEAGYSGFWLYRKLVAAGIGCIVVHPASIEVSSRDTVKTDKRDSLKIAQQLAAGRLRGVRVPTEEEEELSQQVKEFRKVGHSVRSWRISCLMTLIRSLNAGDTDLRGMLMTSSSS
jgi:hypothetical protein